MQWFSHVHLGVFLLAVTFTAANARSSSELFNELLEERDVEIDLCGRSMYMAHHMTEAGGVSDQRKKRIVGGIKSQPNEWPWLVSMMLWNDTTDQFEHGCGGTLISDRWVLSVAHCFDSDVKDFLTDDPLKWVARVGEHNLYEEDRVQPVDMAVKQIIKHPGFDVYNVLQNFDIALVELSERVELNQYVNTACLPNQGDEVLTDTICVAAGWGHEVENGTVSPVVNRVVLPIIENERCAELHALGPRKFPISDNQLCAGLEEGGKDACQYDSGGPFVCLDRRRAKAHWVLTGVVSYGFGCARPGLPGIYTRVSSFIDWINEQWN